MYSSYRILANCLLLLCTGPPCGLTSLTINSWSTTSSMSLPTAAKKSSSVRAIIFFQLLNFIQCYLHNSMIFAFFLFLYFFFFASVTDTYQLLSKKKFKYICAILFYAVVLLYAFSVTMIKKFVRLNTCYYVFNDFTLKLKFIKISKLFKYNIRKSVEPI